MEQTGLSLEHGKTNQGEQDKGPNLDDYVIFTDHFWRNNFNKLITDQNGSQK
jgi:hypothetical protein